METNENTENELEVENENNIENNEEKNKLIQDFVNELHEKIEEEKSKIVLIVDRFEGNVAVCENRENEEMTNIDISELPENVREGDVLRFNNNKYEIDEKTREEIENRIKNKIRNLFVEE